MGYTNHMRSLSVRRDGVIRIVHLLVLCCFLYFPQSQAAAQDQEGPVELRAVVEQMKVEPRGPFEKIQWFCNDGTMLPPGEGACREHGGGKQFGAWNGRTLELRNQGYLLANVLAATRPENYIGPYARLDELRQILLERFLIGIDDGWVFRQARFYRGAMQNEDEQHAAREMVLAMLSDPDWQSPERFLLLRESVRLLPISVKPLVWVDIRQQATEISEKDEGFKDLRFKIHSLPDAQDAERVRGYAEQSGVTELQPEYERLAAGLESLYAKQTTVRQLQQLAGESRNKGFKREINAAIKALGAAQDAAEAIVVASLKGQAWRQTLLGENDYTVYNRLRLLRASLVLEGEVYAQGNRLYGQIEGASRKVRLGWLRQLGAALHASGFLSDRQWQEARTELEMLAKPTSLSVAEYHAGLRYLARVPQWAQQSMDYHFGSAVERWSDLTPLASRFVPDRLRGSPLLLFSRVLDTLTADANRLAGIRHTLFGREIASGLRALNPGLRRGVLLLPPESGQMRADGIYILQSTEQELPPVAGIITRGEGSSLSHVQLLARNMGIPNVVADGARIAAIQSHAGEAVVMAVSQRGVVYIEPDSPIWDAAFQNEVQADDIHIEADLDKLDLQDQAFKPLSALRAEDSGRSVGPKAANLGELMHYYPDRVNPGLVIPFGVFRSYLEQPIADGGPTIFEWMRSEYARLASIANEEERNREAESFLTRLRQRIVEFDLDDAFRENLRQALAETFGEEGSYGLFVRSDTNIEDLASFNGAGLNLTVPNVVSFDEIVSAIVRVWASPFSNRAYAWRQSHMSSPEHVYPSVLLMKSFASEKSGVLVTADVDNGERGWLSVATNEGVGGAVEGQSAEELRIERATGKVRLMAQASSPRQAVLGNSGGVTMLPASGREQLLSAGEIEQLRRLAEDVEQRFPLPKGADGLPLVADIEFGFNQGQLALFQIRPFVESSRARQSQTLLAMDRRLTSDGKLRVELDAPPNSSNEQP